MNFSITWRPSDGFATLFDILADAGTVLQAQKKSTKAEQDAGHLQFCSFRILLTTITNIGKMAGDRRRCRHGRTHQMGAATGALPPLEIAIRGRGATLARIRRSSFMARHIEQPGWRHSKPAAVNILSRPSASAWRLDQTGTRNHQRQLDIGGDMATPGHGAAARRSSMRELVQEPMKTLSMAIWSMRMRGVRPMYCRARSTPSLLTGSLKSSGAGTKPSMGAPFRARCPRSPAARCGLHPSRQRVEYRASGPTPGVRQ
jgi:hypothetical protein